MQGGKNDRLNLIPRFFHLRGACIPWEPNSFPGNDVRAVVGKYTKARVRVNLWGLYYTVRVLSFASRPGTGRLCKGSRLEMSRNLYLYICEQLVKMCLKLEPPDTGPFSSKIFELSKETRRK